MIKKKIIHFLLEFANLKEVMNVTMTVSALKVDMAGPIIMGLVVLRIQCKEKGKKLPNALKNLALVLVVDQNSGFGFGRNWTFSELSVPAEIILLVHRK